MKNKRNKVYGEAVGEVEKIETMLTSRSAEVLTPNDLRFIPPMKDTPKELADAISGESYGILKDYFNGLKPVGIMVPSFICNQINAIV